MKFRRRVIRSKGLVADPSSAIANSHPEFQKLFRLTRRVLVRRMFSALARIVLSVALACCSITDSLAQPAPSADPNPAGDIPSETVVLPESVPDPIEPFNRVVWGFNKGLM